jgi:hypothetical protein
VLFTVRERSVRTSGRIWLQPRGIGERHQPSSAGSSQAAKPAHPVKDALRRFQQPLWNE